MLTENHDFAHEHPEKKDKIHTLKVNDAHFAKLFDEYHEVNKEILRIEKEMEAASDERMEDLKKKRLHLNDEMMAMLSKAA
jgi:uncharacterized protein YdcH (DUF465 family)